MFRCPCRSCCSGVHYQKTLSEPNLWAVGFKCACKTNTSGIHVSVEKNRATDDDCDTKIAGYHSFDKFSTNDANIPSKRKLPYPPLPSPRSSLPSRRRVSFCEVIFADRCETDQSRSSEMQDNHKRSCRSNDDIEEHNSTYDLWQANGSVGKNDGGYETSFNANRNENEVNEQLEQYADCCNNTEGTLKKHDEYSENFEKSVKNVLSEETVPIYVHKTVQNSLNEFVDNERMRGGCGGAREACLNDHRPVHSHRATISNTENSTYNYHAHNRDYNYVNTKSSNVCSHGKSGEDHYDSTSCIGRSPCFDKHGCCLSANDRPVCKKSVLKCRQSCTGESRSCGAGGCCGGGCRGGCGKPGQTCMPSKSCAMSPSRGRSPSTGSPCSPSRSASPQAASYHRKTAAGTSSVTEEGDSYGEGGNYGRKCETCCGRGGGTSFCRSRSPRYQTTGSRRCCSNDRAKSTDGAYFHSKPAGCECLGGGPDCQRCGQKVYQAEMQIASGVPYHNICFSCFCCRKPLESLTYQENCGEIYCKQCYVRNFGPQGYGYGMGAGALQTPM